MSRNVRVLGLLLAIVLGACVGVWSAMELSGRGFGRGDMVQVGPWQTSLIIGSDAADPWTRANVARTGLLALPRDENVYFIATHDSDGAPLDSSAVYQVTGTIPATGWWSLGAYDTEHFLFPSEGGHFSISDDVDPGTPDDVAVQVGGGQPQSGDWIETSGSGAMTLTLRLYQHPGWDDDDLRALSLPTVTRMGGTP